MLFTKILKYKFVVELLYILLETNTLSYYILLLTSSFAIIWIFHKVFLKKRIYDEINNRSSHNVIATRSGGISVFLTLFIFSCLSYFFNNEIYDFSFLVPLSLLVAVGLYDDIYKLDFKLKFIFQIIAAKIIIDSGLIIENLHGFMGIYEIGRVFGHLLTIFIIVSIVNSINFIDGIDGLALSVIIVFISAFEFFSMNQTQLINLSTILIISALPMFYFNFRKNKKVFLGDSGSLFLGGVVSIYVIYSLGNSYIIKEDYDLHKILFILSILVYPIVDLIRVFFLRIKMGRSPFMADNNHLHHLLLKKTNNHLLTTVIILLTSLFFLATMQLLF